MTQIRGRDPLHDLQETVKTVTHVVTSPPGVDTARDLLGRVLSPLDAAFDLLEESAEALRGQAEAIEHAASALEQSATLMRTQAELFERTIRTLREPSRLLQTAVGGERGGP
jgi:hypothetical protein